MFLRVAFSLVFGWMILSGLRYNFSGDMRTNSVFAVGVFLSILIWAGFETVLDRLPEKKKAPEPKKAPLSRHIQGGGSGG